MNYNSEENAGKVAARESTTGQKGVTCTSGSWFGQEVKIVVERIEKCPPCNGQWSQRHCFIRSGSDKRHKCWVKMEHTGSLTVCPSDRK